MRHYIQSKKQPGFTLVELLVVIAIIGTLVALLLPAVQAAREAARANTCRNNLKQLHTALSLRETSLGELPGYINKLGIPGDAAANQNRASWVVMTFPYLELTNVSDLWNQRGANGRPNVADSQAFPSIEILICPSDPQEITGQPALSYVGNAGFIGNDRSGTPSFLGDVGGPENAANGVFFDRTRTAKGGPLPADARDKDPFEPEKKMTIAYIQAKGDGTTSTLMLSENLNATHWGYYGAGQGALDAKQNFGFCWEQPMTVIDAIAGGVSTDFSSNAQFRRINGSPQPLTPADSIADMTKNYGFPSSNHPGGVQAAFVGGSVQFLTDQIEGLVYARLMTTNHNKSGLWRGGPGPGSGVPDSNLPQPSDDSY